MKKLLILITALIAIVGNINAQTNNIHKTDNNFNSFLKELKQIKLTTEVVKKKDLNKEINNITNINRLRQAQAQALDSTAIKIKLINSLTYLKNYIKQIQKEKQSTSIYTSIFSYSIKTPKTKNRYYRVDQNELNQKITKLDKYNKRIIKLTSFYRTLKNIKIRPRIYLNNTIAMILSQSEQMINQSGSSSYSQNTLNNTKVQFCTKSKICFGYKIEPIDENNFKIIY